MDRNAEWLNLHHLQCFWLVARKGGLAAAGEALHVTPSTVWAQLKAVEERLGVRLLEKRGRRLALTEQGERVARVADELFALGQEVLAVVRGEETQKTAARIGVVTSVPRFVSSRLLAPVLKAGLRLRLTHGMADELSAQLSARRLDAVLTDEVYHRTAELRATVTPVGSSKLAFFCRPELHAALSPRYPRSLEGAPFLLPPLGTSHRASVDDALEQLKVQPRVVAEVDDSALIKALAAEGRGVLAAPELVRSELETYFGLRELSPLNVTVTYQVLTLDPRARHPAVKAMLEAARPGVSGGSV